jgi:hypothetical protein
MSAFKNYHFKPQEIITIHQNQYFSAPNSRIKLKLLGLPDDTNQTFAFDVKLKNTSGDEIPIEFYLTAENLYFDMGSWTSSPYLFQWIQIISKNDMPVNIWISYELNFIKKEVIS